MSGRIKAVSILLNLSIILLSLATVVTLGPRIESRFFPVYTQFEILKIEETASGGTQVVFRYEKLRNCKPAGVNWFIGEPGGAYRQVEMLSQRPPLAAVNRPLGENTTVPYTIDVAPAVLINRGFATIYNNCHPFWLTQSSIYP